MPKLGLRLGCVCLSSRRCMYLTASRQLLSKYFYQWPGLALPVTSPGIVFSHFKENNFSWSTAVSWATLISSTLLIIFPPHLHQWINCVVSSSKKQVEEQQEVKKKTDGDIKEVGGPEHSQSGHWYNGKQLIPGTTLYASISRKPAK